MLTPEQFIRLWQTSNSLDDIEKNTELTRSALQSRASLYRKHGVKLQRFGRARITNWSSLAELADSFDDYNGHPKPESTEDS